MVLQINVSKVTIETGHTLGELLVQNFQRHKYLPISLGISIVFGCMAYQAGNLLGAALGLSLFLDIDQKWIVLIIVILASLLLWFGTTENVVRFLGKVVAFMGIVFIYIAIAADLDWTAIFASILIPTIPNKSEILVLGLIGTTIVPYNLFLGSGLSKGKTLKSSYVGLGIAIAIGGVISVAILMAGTLVAEPFNFVKLANALKSEVGRFATILLGLGLFAAGFTSSITAPLAAIFTVRSIFPNQSTEKRHHFINRSIWISVMSFGLIFGFLDIKPIPAIVMAQAINGIILPFISAFILVLVFKSGLKNGIKSKRLGIIILVIVVWVILFLGVFNLIKLAASPSTTIIVFSGAISFLILSVTLIYLSRREKI